MSSKNTYFFSHDANAHEDDKIVCLMSEYGSQGYGWWWILVETLFQQEGCSLDLSKKSTMPHLFRMMWDMPIKDIPSFIDYLVDIELLTRDGDIVYSESLIKRTEKIDELRSKRSAAARARWDKVKKDKEDKLEKAEAKKKPTVDNGKGIAVLNDDDKWSEFKKELKAHDTFKVVPEKVMDSERSICLDWLASKGTTKKDYKAFFRNWLKRKIEDKGFDNPTNNNGGRQMVY